ncbi:MAG: hypothetical protein ACXU8S_01845 [Phenylobacterium sp.]
MGDFSFGDAIGVGFRVVGRAPLSVLAWAATYLLLVFGPALALLKYGLPAMIAAAEAASAHPEAADASRFMALQSGVMVWQPAVWLLSIACTSILMAAIFRAVLAPQESRWAYLRLGRQELWLGLTYLVLMVMAFIMFFCLMLPIGIGAGIIAALSGQGSSGPGGAILLVVLAVAGFGAIGWVLIRLSLALPMSFAQGRFLLYESWDLTRGHAAKIFLVYLALMLALIVLEAVIAATVGVSLVSQIRAGASSGPPTLSAILELIRRNEALIVGLGLVGSVLAMVIHTVFVAPLALIYRELTVGGEAGA